MESPWSMRNMLRRRLDLMAWSRCGTATRFWFLAALAGCGAKPLPHPGGAGEVGGGGVGGVGGTSKLCNGGFSDGSSINAANPTYLSDVPGDQIFCDFHTFAWNQFLYFTQMQPDPNNGGQVTPLFLHQAPWYNALKINGSAQPGPFPGGNTALQVSQLDQGQAGDDDQLLDVKNATVLYDIRFNADMYNAIVNGNLYTEALFSANCQPGSDGTCSNPLYLPPTSASPPAATGSVEF